MIAQGEQAVAELAEREMLADLIRDALLTHFDGIVRPVHRVVLRRFVDQSAAAGILAGIDAAREAAAGGGSREAAIAAFSLALMGDEQLPAAPVGAAGDPAEAQEIRRAHVARVGEDAYLLERMAADREAYAQDATGIDSMETVQAAADAERLRALALRHAVHHARRDVLPRPPYSHSESSENEK